MELDFKDEKHYQTYIWKGNEILKQEAEINALHFSYQNDEDDYDLYLEKMLDYERKMLIDYTDEYGVQYSLKKKILLLCPKSLSGIYSVPEGIIAIHPQAFRGCEKLSEIILPKSLIWIGYSAFENCSSLSHFLLPQNIKIIPSSCFCNCVSLQSVEFGKNLVEINNGAFYDCDLLSDVQFPLSLQIINNCAFNGCIGLESITIPQNVKHIGDAAFYSTSIKSVVWNATIVEDFQRIDYDEYKRKVVLDAWQIFDNNSIESISFGDTVEHIPAYLMHTQSINELILPNSVKSIGDQAFSFCGKLRKIKFSPNLSHIGIDAFYAIHFDIKQQFMEELNTYSETKALAILLDGVPEKYLCNVYIDDLSTWCKVKLDSKYSNPLLALSKYGRIYINGKNTENLIIEEGIDILPDYCFAGWATIRKVKLPSTIKRIGVYSFYKCKELKTIEFKGDVAEVELSAFNYCENLHFDKDYEHFNQTKYSLEISPKGMQYKIYENSSVLSFGKYKNKSINSIINSDVHYIIWCLHHLDHFAVSMEVERCILSKYPDTWRALSIYSKFDIAPYELNSPYREMYYYNT